jgi:hypothetical protein
MPPRLGEKGDIVTDGLISVSAAEIKDRDPSALEVFVFREVCARRYDLNLVQVEGPSAGVFHHDQRFHGVRVRGRIDSEGAGGLHDEKVGVVGQDAKKDGAQDALHSDRIVVRLKTGIFP